MKLNPNYTSEHLTCCSAHGNPSHFSYPSISTFTTMSLQIKVKSGSSIWGKFRFAHFNNFLLYSRKSSRILRECYMIPHVNGSKWGWIGWTIILLIKFFYPCVLFVGCRPQNWMNWNLQWDHFMSCIIDFCIVGGWVDCLHCYSSSKCCWSGCMTIAWAHGSRI